MSAVPVERLTVEDARILACERGAVVGHTCKVLVVDGEHDVNAFRARVGSRLAAVPRLLDRLVETPFGIAPPAWLPDPDFAIERHVREGGRVRDQAALERAVAALMESRLDREHPLWSLDVLALDDGRTAGALRLHHCMADGTVAMRIVGTLLLDQDWAVPVSASVPNPAVGPRRATLFANALRWRFRSATRRAAGTAPARGSGGTSAGAEQRRLAVIRRELAPGSDLSPLARRAGRRRTVAFSTFALHEVKQLAHAVPGRATVNDVVLAAVAGGIRRWLTEIGAEAHELRVKVPVSLHSQDEPGLANRDSFMVVHLPLDEPDPLVRLVVIAAETRERKAAHDADALDALFNDLGRRSRSLERLAEHWAKSPRVFALNVSNVPGPQGELTVLGSPLLAMHSLAEIAERHVLRVAVISAAGRLSFGLCADADAVERLDLVADGIDAELQALGAALPA
jgi:diacylglycerol O-acyltransferase / wax synthase